MSVRKVTKKILEQICDRLAMGESLLKICREDGMPSYRSITRTVQGNEEMWEIYRRARVLQCEFFADHINDLAVTPLPDGDSVDNRVLNAEVQRRRLEIDTLKWTLARMQPYGLRDKKEDANANMGSITLSWANGEVSTEVS